MSADTDYSFVTGFSLLLTLLVLIYLYLRRIYNFWKVKGIPQTETLPFLGSIHEYFGKPIHEIELKRYMKYGRLFGSYEGLKPFLYVADPQLLKNILVKDFHIFTNRRQFDLGDKVVNKVLSAARDQEWKRIRSVVSPTFTSGKLRKMVVLIKECAENMVKHGKKLAEKGEPIDCKPIYGAFALDVIASVAFGTKLNSLEDPNNLFVKHAKALGSKSSLKFLLLVTFPRLSKLLRVTIFSQETITYYRNVIVKIIQERKEKNEKHNDFLQLMIDAHEGTVESSSESKESIASDQGNRPTASDKTLTMDEVLAQAIVFFLSGYDMAANPIGFITYNLANNPQCQEKLIEETDEVWDKHGGVDFDIVMKMPYLHAVICESQRIFSVLPRAERVCREDYKLGDTGLVIPKGTTIAIPIYAMHHDPEWFPNPEKFEPERFFPENQSLIPPYAYLPFGEGPRNCVAERFAMMEMKMCLVYMLRHFRFVATEETKRPLEFNTGQPTLQSKKVIIKLESR